MGIRINNLWSLLGSQKHCEIQQRFAKCLATLNYVAHTHGKGRDDFDAEVLERATAVLQTSTLQESAVHNVTHKHSHNGSRRSPCCTLSITASRTKLVDVVRCLCGNVMTTSLDGT